MRPGPVIPSPAIVECSVRGCGWQAEIPVTYRLERVQHETPTFGDPGQMFVDTRVVVDEAAVEAFDAYLAGHAFGHEIVETVLGAP